MPQSTLKQLLPKPLDTQPLLLPTPFTAPVEVEELSLTSLPRRAPGLIWLIRTLLLLDASLPTLKPPPTSPPHKNLCRRLHLPLQHYRDVD
ncbi:hypothetical protein AAVH_10427 [Aphelenchoides avenae]|nr:hypothetical protein AAVH_10427 [Aphelenchus avenae]